MKKPYIYTAELNLAVLLFGGAGLFGKLLDYPAVIIVLSRVVFSALTLYFFAKIRNKNLRFNRKKSYLWVFITAILLSLHWISFFQSVKLSTVAIALFSFSTFPVFISLIEPLVFGLRFSFKELFAALIALVGIYILIPSFNFSSLNFKGVITGIISGFLFALLSIVNKVQVKNESSFLITFYQHLFSIPILLPSVFLLKRVPTSKDFFYFFLLGAVFTALAHLLFIDSLVKFKAFISGLFATLEPVYGAFFAFLILNEIPSVKTIIGGLIVLCASLYAIIFSEKGG